MKVSPISLNQYNSKNPSFNAVNQKYLKLAKENYERYKPYHNQGHLLTMLNIEVAYGLMSFQDGIDTLEAIKKYDPLNIDIINIDITRMKEAIKKSNQ